MAEEKKSIFRQKSLDRISSPEELDQYLQVTKPTTWLVLGAVVILLIGFISWGFLGRLSSVLTVPVTVADGKAICYIPDSQAQYIESGQITIGNESYEVVSTGLAKIMVDENTPEVLLESGLLTVGDVVRPYEVNGKLENGIYQGEIVIEQVSPIHFIIN